MSKPFVAVLAYLQALTSNEIFDLIDNNGEFAAAVALKLCLPRWAVESACADFLADLICEALEEESHYRADRIFEVQECSALVAALKARGQETFIAEFRQSLEPV